MADGNDPMDNILGGVIGSGGESGEQPARVTSPTAATTTPAVEEATSSQPARTPARRQSRSRSGESSSSRSRRRPTASAFPADWISVQLSVPEETNNRAGSQMRPQKVGLKPGQGKTPGRRYALSIKLAAVDRFLGNDLDTSGFVFGNEKQAIGQVEDAILAKAERILAERASRNAA